jgi:hypothetical protein
MYTNTHRHTHKKKQTYTLSTLLTHMHRLHAGTNKPANSRFTSSGQPSTTDTCTWECNAWGTTYYQSSDSCVTCTTSSCPVGQYRVPCTRYSDATCVPCTNTKPANSIYTTAGVPYNANTCAWACAAGYFRNSAGTCTAEVSYAVLVSNLALDTSEVPGSNPASFAVALSRRPSGNVVVTLTTGSQLSGNYTLTFMPQVRVQTLCALGILCTCVEAPRTPCIRRRCSRCLELGLICTTVSQPVFIILCLTA